MLVAAAEAAVGGDRRRCCSLLGRWWSTEWTPCRRLLLPAVALAVVAAAAVVSATLPGNADAETASSPAAVAALTEAVRARKERYAAEARALAAALETLGRSAAAGEDAVDSIERAAYSAQRSQELHGGGLPSKPLWRLRRSHLLTLHRVHRAAVSLGGAARELRAAASGSVSAELAATQARERLRSLRVELRPRMLFVHLRKLNLREGCDQRLGDLMIWARQQGFEPTFVSLSQPRETDMPVDRSHCEQDVDAWLAGQSASERVAPVPEPNRSMRSLSLLDGVAEFQYRGGFCEGVVWTLQLLARNCFAALVSPVWFWNHDAVPGHLFPAVQRAERAGANSSRRLMHRPLLVALSDDAHTEREGVLEASEVCEAQRLYFASRRRKVSVMERRVYAHSDAAVFISRKDLATSRALLAPACTGLVVNAVPPPVASGGSSPGWSARRGLIFVGNGGNPTNNQGIWWFLKGVWPILRSRLPGVRFVILGMDPLYTDACVSRQCHCGWGDHTQYKSLDKNGVTHYGEVTDEDIRKKLAQARVFVSPVINATGVITKSFQAYMNQLPLVMTDVAASGLDRSHDSLGAVVTPVSAAAFATAVAQLYTSEERWNATRARMAAAAKSWGHRSNDGKALSELTDFVRGRMMDIAC
eukprot:TRINITY_DN35097_c0_g1_i1.p1 TRINITY_DN35097_c0_g1~~TRINITY_DN35097_c0_g1_i1.p1  ORF type:complete len:646 (+),score=147.90 TRINITY_DN35097_c0_g1_i1:68-2005(+)